jgi:hypothetical protein
MLSRNPIQALEEINRRERELIADKNQIQGELERFRSDLTDALRKTPIDKLPLPHLASLGEAFGLVMASEPVTRKPAALETRGHSQVASPEAETRKKRGRVPRPNAEEHRKDYHRAYKMFRRAGGAEALGVSLQEFISMPRNSRKAHVAKVRSNRN